MQKHVSVPNAATVDPMAEAYESIKAAEAQVDRIASVKALKNYVRDEDRNNGSLRDCLDNMRGALTNLRDGLEAFSSKQMGPAMGFAAAAFALAQES